MIFPQQIKKYSRPDKRMEELKGQRQFEAVRKAKQNKKKTVQHIKARCIYILQVFICVMHH